MQNPLLQEFVCSVESVCHFGTTIRCHCGILVSALKLRGCNVHDGEEKDISLQTRSRVDGIPQFREIRTGTCPARRYLSIRVTSCLNRPDSFERTCIHVYQVIDKFCKCSPFDFSPVFWKKDHGFNRIANGQWNNKQEIGSTLSPDESDTWRFLSFRPLTHTMMTFPQSFDIQTLFRSGSFIQEKSQKEGKG